MMMPYRRLWPLVVAIFASAFALAHAPVQGARLAQATFMGRAMFGGHIWHGLPTALGATTFSAPNSPWLDEGWLGALGIFVFQSSAWIFGVSEFLAASALILVERRCRQRGLGDIPTALALAIALMCSLGALHVGGGALDLAFTAAFLLFIERAPRKSAWWAIPIALVWCNASVYGFIAPFLGALSASGRSFGPSFRDRLRRAAFYLLPILAMLLTPASTHIFSRYIADLHLDPTREIEPWKAQDVSPLAFYGGFVPALTLAAFFGLYRVTLSDAVTAIGAMFLVMLNAQYLGMAGILLGPIVATAWANAREARRIEYPASSPHERIALLSVALLAATCAGRYAAAQGVPLIPSHDTRTIARFVHGDRLFCADVSVCDYALLSPNSGVRVFMDTRNGYPARVRNDMSRLVMGAPGWREELDAWRITDVITPGIRLESLLSLLPNWTCAQASQDAWVCERK